MKMSQGKKISLILAGVLMVLFWWNQSVATVSAATPTFTKSSIEIVGEKENYQMEIINKVSGSTYKWSSSNTKVANISSKGLVTTVNKGTSTIKCKITDPTGKSKTISSKVVVTIPATEVMINNATEVNGAHVLLLGEKFNFNRDITPKNSSDKTYWSIGGGDAECINIDSTSSGIVSGTKVGKVILVATAAKTATMKDVTTSFVNDAIIIEVVGPSASIRSAEIISSTELKVVFDSPIDRNSVIGVNNTLLNSIEVSMRKDTKGVMAKDPGVLTASLSSDLKTLIITTTNTFEGEYGINFTNKIKTTEGVLIEEYYKQLTYIDNIPPTIVGFDLDDETGMISTIRFSEAIDFTNFKVSNATVVPTGQTTATAEQSTISILNNKLNYIVSADKKSVSINLSRIVATDYNKKFSVTISGIVDMSGIEPASFTLTAYVRTDNSLKPEARPITVLRTSYNTITATFDRAIDLTGIISFNNNTYTGTVDSNNNKKVNYTISEIDAQLTGFRTVSLGFWKGYNVNPADTYANQFRNFNVDFTTDNSSPVLLKNEFDAATNTLTLTYNKEVILSRNSGIFSSTLVTNMEDILSGTNISYTMIVSTDNKVIKLSMSNMTLIGYYTFTLESGFVRDQFRNLSLTRNITISNADGNINELPGPYLITQSDTNLSQITLEFAHKLDLVSAQTVSNYKIAGVNILSAKVMNNTSDRATVLLTVMEGSMIETVERPITINGVKGYNGSFSEIVGFYVLKELKDNKKPEYKSPTIFDRNLKNVIRLNFDEQIQGNLIVRVTQLNTGMIEYANTVTITGNSAIITLATIPPNGSSLRIEVIANNITDASGNTAIMQNTMGVLVSY